MTSLKDVVSNWLTWFSFDEELDVKRYTFKVKVKMSKSTLEWELLD